MSFMSSQGNKQFTGNEFYSPGNKNSTLCSIDRNRIDVTHMTQTNLSQLEKVFPDPRE